MTELDTFLADATARSPGWNSGSALEVAEGLSRTLGAAVDWDGEAGEEWVRVLGGDRVEALLSTRIPLGIRVGGPGGDHPAADRCVWVEVPSWDVPCLTVSDVVLRDVFGSVRTEMLMSPFSVHDLWYATL